MKCIAVLAATFITLILAGCSAEEKTPEEPPERFTISLERTACFGTCPVYTVAVNETGKVTYDGEMCVQVTGAVEEQIPPEDAMAVWEELPLADFWSYNSAYNADGSGCTEWHTDAQTVIITVTGDGDTKSVSHYHGCEGPAELSDLTALEDSIDSLLGTEKWVGDVGLECLN